VTVRRVTATRFRLLDIFVEIADETDDRGGAVRSVVIALRA
jgi:hypothetical protein